LLKNILIRIIRSFLLTIGILFLLWIGLGVTMLAIEKYGNNKERILSSATSSITADNLEAASYFFKELKHYDDFARQKGVDPYKYSHYLTKGTTPNPFIKSDTEDGILYRIDQSYIQRLFLYIFENGDIYLFTAFVKMDFEERGYCCFLMYIKNNQLVGDILNFCENQINTFPIVNNPPAPREVRGLSWGEYIDIYI